jgi:Tfp pilus assembly protein PilN
MINLLADESKKEILAARTNVKLVNYMVVLGLGVAFLAVISVGVYFVLMNSQADAEKLINQGKTKTATYTSIEAQGQALRNSLSSAKTILDQEVVYTKILTSIAALIPKGIVLDSINLSPTTIGAPITLQFYAKTTQDTLSLKDSFQGSPLFSSVSFQTLSSTPSTQSSEYPISASLNVTINKGAAK